jgi:hypothetical protein
LRIITLNAWCGRALYPLMKFLEREAPKTDIFCFQEVFATTQESVDSRHADEFICGDLFQRMERLLVRFGFEGLFLPRPDGPHRMSQAMFWKRASLPIPGFYFGGEPIFLPEETVDAETNVPSSRLCQYLKFQSAPKQWLAIINYHGLWNGGHKQDCPERLEQSRRLNQVARQLSSLGPDDDSDTKVIICGDLNLDVDTESVRLLGEGAGRQDLIAEYGIRNTRTPMYRHYHDPDYSFNADYVFVDRGITVRHFAVLRNSGSDHAALAVKIDV